MRNLPRRSGKYSCTGMPFEQWARPCGCRSLVPFAHSRASLVTYLKGSEAHWRNPATCPCCLTPSIAVCGMVRAIPHAASEPVRLGSAAGSRTDAAALLVACVRRYVSAQLRICMIVR
jgi:hypothetical protein